MLEDLGEFFMLSNRMVIGASKSGNSLWWLTFFSAGPSAGLSFLGRDYVQLLGQFLQPSQAGDSWTWFSFSFSASLSDIFCLIMHAISRNLQTISMNVCAFCVFCNVLCRNGLFEDFERGWVGGMVVCIGIKPSAILSHDAHACWCHDGVGVRWGGGVAKRRVATHYSRAFIQQTDGTHTHSSGLILTTRMVHVQPLL